MPYKSRAQQKKFHAMEARGEISHSTVKEFDKATNFGSLPDRVRKKKARRRAIGKK